MFTGIIEEVGNVQKISRQQQALALTISAKKVLEDVRRNVQYQMPFILIYEWMLN